MSWLLAAALWLLAPHLFHDRLRQVPSRAPNRTATPAAQLLAGNSH